ncbi:MAG: hypothetical protein ACR2NA_05105, partial [Solirubrobacterales bacterium]
TGAAAQPAPQATASAAASGRRWLEGAQNRDGGWGSSRGASSNPLMTGWAMLGLAAAGRNPQDVRKGGNSPVTYLRRNAKRIRLTGDLERTILALRAAGVSPRSFAGRDLVTTLRKRRSANGSWERQIGLTSFGILALRAAGIDKGVLQKSASWLRQQQRDSGGWSSAPGLPAEIDVTGAALQALASAGGSGTAIDRGVAFLRRHQKRSGGWGLRPDGSANSQSTAWAAQGLIAAGLSPSSVRRAGGSSAMGYLAGRQASDGHYKFSSADRTPVWVTGQVLPAVTGRKYPIAPPRRRANGGSSSSSGGSSSGGGSAAGGGTASAETGTLAGKKGAASGGSSKGEKDAKESSSAETADQPPAPKDRSKLSDRLGGGAANNPTAAGRTAASSGVGTWLLVLGGLAVVGFLGGWELRRRRRRAA